MAKRGGKNRNHFYSNSQRNGCLPRSTYVQSVGLNERIYSYYRNLIVQLAVSRFRWINLPKTCDANYLELQLLLEGCACIAFPPKMRGTFLSLKASTNGRPNMYDIPSKWIAIGQNGTRFQCNNTNGVLVFDNVTRYPLMNGIDLYARELTQIRTVRRTNRMHQQVPFILKGDARRKQDMINLFRNVADGEPAVLGLNGIEEINYEALSTGVPYIAEMADTDERAVWNQIYLMLGMSNLPYKAERQTEDEIRAQKSPAEKIMLASLGMRRKASDKLNERFGDMLEAPVMVEVNQDNESDNWNLVHNVRDMYETGE